MPDQSASRGRPNRDSRLFLRSPGCWLEEPVEVSSQNSSGRVGWLRLVPLTLALSRREREHRIPRRDESTCSGLAQARRAILPLPKGEGGVRGKQHSKKQCAWRLTPVVPGVRREICFCVARAAGSRSRSN